MQCRVCKEKTSPQFCKVILNKYECEYFYCANCGFLQTQEPFWLNEAYESPIALADTGILQRNYHLIKSLSLLIYSSFPRNSKFIDVAGGYGIFVRLMRDVGFDFYWNDKYTKNLFSQSFEVELEPEANFVAATAFEVFEHLEDPLSFVDDVLEQAKIDTLIFTTELFNNQPPSPDSWWYYSFPTGQHISFYQKRTLEYIAQKFNCHFLSHKGIHILTKKNISPLLLHISTIPIIGKIFVQILKKIIPSKTMSDHFELIKNDHKN